MKKSKRMIKIYQLIKFNQIYRFKLNKMNTLNTFIILIMAFIQLGCNSNNEQKNEKTEVNNLVSVYSKDIMESINSDQIVFNQKHDMELISISYLLVTKIQNNTSDNVRELICVAIDTSDFTKLTIDEDYSSNWFIKGKNGREILVRLMDANQSNVKGGLSNKIITAKGLLRNIQTEQIFYGKVVNGSYYAIEKAEITVDENFYDRNKLRYKPFLDKRNSELKERDDKLALYEYSRLVEDFDYPFFVRYIPVENNDDELIVDIHLESPHNQNSVKHDAMVKPTSEDGINYKLPVIGLLLETINEIDNTAWDRKKIEAIDNAIDIKIDTLNKKVTSKYILNKDGLELNINTQRDFILRENPKNWYDLIPRQSSINGFIKYKGKNYNIEKTEIFNFND